MNFVQKNFREVSDECYAWTMHSDDGKKEIKCNLNGIDVLIIFTRMVWSDHKGVITPNRMNVGSTNPIIEALFKEHLWQPKPYPNWDERLWVFKNNPNVSLPHVQYELRFFPSEDSLNNQLANESPSSCTLL